ncbi:RadC family protein [Flavobacterium selenitireducens]|uniref:RadC family protein n=1 Tax=Flavobacterium selenitireducens TaxID=2722704 RepID=UPI00168B34F5|nr:DNA repair protein RadC [Flavobacterium selenitireducens]MBD3583994.1 DNA repair protein RadC [Flavobacterium selenitireducens]
MSETTSFPMRFWSDDDRPREKMILKGKSALSDAELIAILIGSGTRTETAVDLSKRMLANVGNNLNELSRLTLAQLTAYKGIGEAKAVAISAAMELARRKRESETRVLAKISSSHDVFVLMQPLIGELAHEEFWILYMNNANKILNKTQLSKGGMTGTVVDVRLVFKIALQHGATGVILCHNHPSGTLKASEADRQITRKLKSAGENLDIKVLDHLIVTENAYLSFADEGIL